MPTVAPPAPADPAGPGFAAFGLTTVLLSLTNAGVLPAQGTIVVLPLALVFGGVVQLGVGAVEFRRGNTFGATASCSYGAFWIWYALLGLLANGRLVNLAGARPTLGAALLLWGVLTLYLWLCTFRMAKIVFVVFFTLWIDYLLLGTGPLTGVVPLTRADGWLGLVCGASALLASFDVVRRETIRPNTGTGPA